MSTLHVQPFYPHSYPHSRHLQSLQTSCRPNVLRLTVGVTSLTLHGEGRSLRVAGQADKNNNSKARPQKTNNLSCINNKLTKLSLSETAPPKLLIQTRLPSTANVVEDKNNCKTTPLPSNTENKKVNNVNQLSDNRCGHDNRTQLLHPDWRKIPWRPYFGWTDAHEKLQTQLKEKIREGCVECIYYKSPEEHVAAGLTWRYHNKDVPFLRGPTVSTVNEVLEVIRRVNSTRPHNYCNNRLSRWNRQDNLANVEYDADDED